MPGKRGFALLCCTLVLLQTLQQLPGIQAKRRPAHSHHHSTEAAAGREEKAFELPGGGYLEEEEEEEFSAIVPLEAAEQHFSLMPDRPAVEEEDAEVASPLSQLGEVGAPAKGAYGVFGHHKAAAKAVLPHCTAEGMGQVWASSLTAGPTKGYVAHGCCAWNLHACTSSSSMQVSKLQ